MILNEGQGQEKQYQIFFVLHSMFYWHYFIEIWAQTKIFQVVFFSFFYF